MRITKTTFIQNLAWVNGLFVAITILLVVFILGACQPDPPVAATSPSPALTPTIRKIRVARGVEMEFVYVPAGAFTMGSDSEPKPGAGDERPQHSVTLDGFWIGKTEVTKVQYHPFAKARGSRRQPDQPDHPWEACRGIRPQPMPSSWQRKREEIFNCPQRPSGKKRVEEPMLEFAPGATSHLAGSN